MKGKEFWEAWFVQNGVIRVLANQSNPWVTIPYEYDDNITPSIEGEAPNYRGLISVTFEAGFYAGSLDYSLATSPWQVGGLSKPWGGLIGYDGSTPPAFTPSLTYTVSKSVLYAWWCCCDKKARDLSWSIGSKSEAIHEP